MHHSFDIEIAQEYGIEAAIILANLAFWTTKDIANNHNFFDGLHWIYNSVAAWQKLFPYMSEKIIRNNLNKLEEKGIIKSGNYNDITYNRTKWYALTELGKCICRIGEMHLPKSINGDVQKGKSNCTEGQNINKTVIDPVLKPLSSPPLPPGEEEGLIFDFKEPDQAAIQQQTELAFKNWQEIAAELNIEFTISEWDLIYGYVIAKPKLQRHQIMSRIYQLDKWASEGLDIENALLSSQDTRVMIQPKMKIAHDDRGNRIYGSQIADKRRQQIKKEKSENKKL